jgi:hypothetical protein
MTYQRKRLRPALAVVGGMAGLVFVVWARIPTRVTAFGGEVIEHYYIGPVRAIVIGLTCAGLFLAGVMALMRSRHPIVIDDEGVADAAAFPEKIRWSAVENVQMIGSEKEGYRIEILSGGRGRFIQVGDVEASPGALFQAIFETWTKRRSA